jgi:hypothetical protein
MMRFFKKYWINILLFFLLAILTFIFLPNQESHYLKSDADIVKSKSRTVLLGTEVILFGTILFLLIKNIKKASELLVPTFAIGTFALGFFFLFDSIFLSAGFLMNKLSKRQTVNKKYHVVYFDKEKNLLLQDNSSKKLVQADKLLTKDNSNLTFKIGDTLILSFTKGLLGFNFDPHIKP